MHMVWNILHTLGTGPFPEGLKRIEQAHGFYITFAGMLAVFVGLVILWMSALLFRKLVTAPIQRKEKKKVEIDSSLSPIAMVQDKDEEKTAALIGALIAYYEEYEMDPVKTLPLKHISQEMSPWVMVAREQMLRK